MITEALAHVVTHQMRRSLAAIARCSDIDDSKWAHETIPVRVGGLGIRDPVSVTPCSVGLTCQLIRKSSFSRSRPAYIAEETEKAVAIYMAFLQLTIRPDLQPSKELQNQLTLPFHQQALDKLLPDGDLAARIQFTSLATPHAMAWISTTSLLKLLAPAEGCSLRWVLGILLRDHAYTCPDCGMLAGHSCRDLPAIWVHNSGHSVLRNALIELFRRAGVRVEAEQSIPGRDERPADMLVSSWHGKTAAVDFTIITPTRQSALAQGAAAATTTTTLMDQAAKIKSSAACLDGVSCRLLLICTARCASTSARWCAPLYSATAPVSPRSPKRKPRAPFGAPFPPKQWREQQCNLHEWLLDTNLHSLDLATARTRAASPASSSTHYLVLPPHLKAFAPNPSSA